MFNWPDTFSVVEMTDAVNKLPLMPLRFSGMFETYGLPTTHMAFDCKRGRIILISDSPRNADPEYVTGQTEKRETKILSCTHLSQADTLAPEDLQDVRAFGSTEPVTVESVINDKLSALKRNLDMTLEFHRLGAIKGIVLDADGSTVLHNIFDTFGVTQKKQDLSFPAAVEADKNPILSGIMAAKRTSELIPLCHPLNLNLVDVRFEVRDTPPSVRIEAETRTTGPTGVEMEAIIAAQTAAAVIYDMCKAVDKGMELGEIHLVEKTGGKSGHYIRAEGGYV